MSPPAELLARFGLANVDFSSERLSGGHIHRTWTLGRDGVAQYVAQAVNTAVFPDIQSCERNLDLVDRHLGGSLVPAFLRTDTGQIHAADPARTVWRISRFATGTIGAAAAASTGQAYGAAQQFGTYARRLAELPVDAFAVPIARFHDLDWRMSQLAHAVQEDVAKRADSCREVIATVLDVARRCRITAPPRRRIVHNDAKVANLRFDANTGRAVLVVDLDTTMAGSVLYDIGELVRSGCTQSAEDDPDPDVDGDRVNAVLDGYFAGAGPLVTASDRSLAHFAGPLMAIENASRFLADHLLGDTYFSTTYDGQNLTRARAQARLADLLLRVPAG